MLTISYLSIRIDINPIVCYTNVVLTENNSDQLALRQTRFHLGFGQDSLLKILRLLGKVYTAFSIPRPWETSRISRPNCLD